MDGKEYNDIKEGGTGHSITFNSDGTAKYEETEKFEIFEGYEYKYTVDTDNKAIYCYVEKYSIE